MTNKSRAQEGNQSQRHNSGHLHLVLKKKKRQEMGLLQQGRVCTVKIT